MEKKFIKVQSAKDIIISTSLITIGFIFATISGEIGFNIGGYTLILTGIVLAFILKSEYKDIETKEKYTRETFLFPGDMKASILSALLSTPESIKISENGKGQVLRLELYYSKKSGKAYLQLFEYIPHQYSPCSDIYEYEIKKIEKLLK